MRIVLEIIRRLCFIRQWRKKNAHNETTVKRPFNPARVKVGRKTYGELNDAELMAGSIRFWTSVIFARLQTVFFFFVVVTITQDVY